MRTVHLYGWLAEKYGNTLKFDVSSISELMRAMKANFKDWETSIRDDEFEVVVGKDLDSNHLGENELYLNFNNDDDFHLAPSTQARKEGGWLQVIIGVVLIVVGIVVGVWTGWTGVGGAAGVWMIKMGAAMVLGGVVQLIMGPPDISGMDYTEREKADERPSFLFKGGVNNIEQGGPVPLVYGQIMCGSTIISASIRNEDI